MFHEFFGKARVGLSASISKHHEQTKAIYWLKAGHYGKSTKTGDVVRITETQEKKISSYAAGFFFF